MRAFAWHVGALVTIILGSFLPFSSSYASMNSGAEIYNEFLEKGLIYPDEDWQEYVVEVGNRLLATIPKQNTQYTFVVVDQSIVNAWATPDGYIFLTRGLLAHLNSEDEMASVIGHEIGHVYAKHTKKTVGRDRLNKIMGILGMFATGTSATSSLVNTVGTAQLAGYRREHELEADELGLLFLIRAGYDPYASLESIQVVRDHDNFGKLSGNKPTIYHGILGSHPAHTKRLNELISQSRGITYSDLELPERDYLKMLSGLRFGEETSTGVVKDGKYYHGTLRLVVEFPEGWSLMATPSEISSSSSSVNEKATIKLKRMAPSSEVSTPEEYVTEVLKRDDLEDAEQFLVGYYPAFMAKAKQIKENSLSKIAVVFKDGGIYLFTGEYRDGTDQQAFEDNFLATVQSFRALSAEDMRLISDQKIRVVMANPGDTYAKMAAYSPIGRGGEGILRLINGDHPNGEPRAGDFVKIVE